ncbi:hypothetical protein [Neorhizobium phenanthreniclasticum]|uniref:hypothetical protein n=1 Tax=Neorhizobium phenanthreniclasticum TaxID=3157917 RepID=UPI0039F4847A
MERLDNLRPLILFVSGMMGAMGVALAAAASHAGDTLFLGSASTMCLAHAIGGTVEGTWLAYSRKTRCLSPHPCAQVWRRDDDLANTAF